MSPPMHHKKKKEQLSSLEKLDNEPITNCKLCLTKTCDETCQPTHSTTTFEDGPNITISNIQGDTR